MGLHFRPCFANASTTSKNSVGFHLNLNSASHLNLSFATGLTCEGIYRISGVKSKVQALKDAYNKGLPVQLQEYEPSVVASLIKQFLRELPEPILTTELLPKFELASSKFQST